MLGTLTLQRALKAQKLNNVGRAFYVQTTKIIIFSDHSCHQMRNTSRNINLHGGVERLDPNISIPETWAEHSNRNIQESQSSTTFDFLSCSLKNPFPFHILSHVLTYLYFSLHGGIFSFSRLSIFAFNMFFYSLISLICLSCLKILISIARSLENDL